MCGRGGGGGQLEQHVGVETVLAMMKGLGDILRYFSLTIEPCCRRAHKFPPFKRGRAGL